MSAELPQPERQNPLRRVLSLFSRQPAAEEPAGSPQPSPEPPSPLPSNGKKILLVDDDPIVLKTYSTRLKQQGYAVITAADGSDALGLVRDEHPDLILLDIGFPPDVAQGGRVSWDGFQIMFWMRGLQEASQIPFIVISADDSPACKQRALKAGAVAFFTKGSDFSELLGAIQKQLKT